MAGRGEAGGGDESQMKTQQQEGMTLGRQGQKWDDLRTDSFFREVPTVDFGISQVENFQVTSPYSLMPPSPLLALLNVVGLS